jgi:flagellin
MTRINTNISSIIAQTNLSRANDQLQQSLTRLSTGLRINTGKDDPAGLIASENLRSDINGVQKGISNSQRANQIISTADSALGQVSSLLNDLRGLVSEASNTGAMSEAQIQANQLQVDSSLAAIDRIAQTTSFQGRKLLDGSLDFITSGIIDGKATVTVAGVTDVAASLAGQSGVDFAAVAKGTVGNAVTIAIATGAANTGSVVGSAITITVTTGATAADILNVVSATAAVNALVTASSLTPATAVSNVAATNLAGGVDGNEFIITANSGGVSWNGAQVIITSGGAAPGGETTAYNTTTNVLTVTATSTSTASEILTAINNDGHFNAVLLNSNGSGTAVATGTTTLAGATLSPNKLSNLRINQANFGTSSSIAVEINIDTQATQAALTYSGGTLAAPVVLEVGGDKGFNTFNFGGGTSIVQIRDAVNQLSDATGVTATVDTKGNLILNSLDFGSAGFVSAKALSGTFTTTDGVSPTAITRATGTDIALRINGLKATGAGLNATLNSSTLSLSFTADKTLVAGETVTFSIDGGGAKFQLGPDVVSSQQARFGIQSVSTAQLGGLNGKLFEMFSGGTKALATDARGASAVVSDVINAITTLRGRLGAFQKTTLDTNIATLTDTLSNLIDAQSTIRDADFAAESANLTRGQILVQAGTQVLQISNQRPQAILALLRQG